MIAPKMEEGRGTTAPGRTRDLVKKKPMKTVDFDQYHLMSPLYYHNDVVKSIEPENFTIEYYHKEGLKQVLLFTCKPEELGMKIPPNTFTPRQVMERVGEQRMVQFINVATQQSFSNSFKNFVEYFETPVNERAETYNVISLEVSGTEMEHLVRPPSLVRQLDLASYWPDDRKQRSVEFDTSENESTLFSFDNKYPRVEHYCLMSAHSSYTSFHIDFHGSSVWYHVLSGVKVFFIIEPTDENIKKFEEYLLSDEDDSFFGQRVEKCTRVSVRAGETLILPAGWIHAVWTPMDSLVFGGNFIHPRSLKMQMKIVEHEERLELQKTEKYPQADEVFLHYMDHVVEKVTGRRHIRPTPRNRQTEGLMYVGEKFIDEGRHRAIPNQRDFDKRRRDSRVWESVEESQHYEESRKILDEYKMEYIETTDDFFIEEHPLMLYHPEEFRIEDHLKGSNPCGLPLPKRLVWAQMDIKFEVLESLIHPSEIVQWELLLQVFLNKKIVNLPEGLTRPNSLVHTFYCLLSRRRELEQIKKIDKRAYYHIPPKEFTLFKRWGEEKEKENVTVKRFSYGEPLAKKKRLSLSKAGTTSKSGPRRHSTAFAPGLSSSINLKTPKDEPSTSKALATAHVSPVGQLVFPATVLIPRVAKNEQHQAASKPVPRLYEAKRPAAVGYTSDEDSIAAAAAKPARRSAPAVKRSRPTHRWETSDEEEVTPAVSKPMSRRSFAALASVIGMKPVNNALAKPVPRRSAAAAAAKVIAATAAPAAESKKRRSASDSGVSADVADDEEEEEEEEEEEVARISKKRSSIPKTATLYEDEDADYNMEEEDDDDEGDEEEGNIDLDISTASTPVRGASPAVMWRRKANASTAALASAIDFSSEVDDVLDNMDRDVNSEEEDVEHEDEGEDETEEEATASPSVGLRYSEEEKDVVIRVCMSHLLKQHDAGSRAARWTSHKSTKAAHALLPHRTVHSISHEMRRLKNRPDIKKIIDAFEAGQSDDWVSAAQALAGVEQPSPVAPNGPTRDARRSSISQRYSTAEMDVIVRVCMNQLLKQNDVGSRAANWTSLENVKAVQEQLPERSAHSIRHEMRRVKDLPDIKRIVDDFEAGQSDDWVAAAQALAAALAAPAAPDTAGAQYTTRERDLITRVCTNHLFKQHAAGSRAARWTSNESAEALHAQLPHRSICGIRSEMARLKARPDIKQVLDDFEAGQSTQWMSAAAVLAAGASTAPVVAPVPSTPLAALPANCTNARLKSGRVSSAALLPAAAAAAAFRSPDDPARVGAHYTKQEKDVIVGVCMNQLLQQHEAGSNASHWTGKENQKAVQLILPHRTANSLRIEMFKLKTRSDIKRVLDAFEDGNSEEWLSAAKEFAATVPASTAAAAASTDDESHQDYGMKEYEAQEEEAMELKPTRRAATAAAGSSKKRAIPRTATVHEDEDNDYQMDEDDENGSTALQCPDNFHQKIKYSKEETDVIVRVAMKHLLDQHDAGSTTTLWLCNKNVEAIRAQLPYRSYCSAQNELRRLKTRPDIRKIVDDFEAGESDDWLPAAQALATAAAASTDNGDKQEIREADEDVEMEDDEKDDEEDEEDEAEEEAPKPAKRSARRNGIHQQYSTEETDVIIRVCMNRLLKQHEVGSAATLWYCDENMNDIQVHMPKRSAYGIRSEMRRLKDLPEIKKIVDAFEAQQSDEWVSAAKALAAASSHNDDAQEEAHKPTRRAAAAAAASRLSGAIAAPESSRAAKKRTRTAYEDEDFEMDTDSQDEDEDYAPDSSVPRRRTAVPFTSWLNTAGNAASVSKATSAAAATVRRSLPAAAAAKVANASPSNLHLLYTMEEKDVIIRVCMGQLLKQHDSGSETALWSCMENVKAIQEVLPHRTECSIKMMMQRLKVRPDIKKVIDDFEKRKLSVPSTDDKENSKIDNNNNSADNKNGDNDNGNNNDDDEEEYEEEL